MTMPDTTTFDTFESLDAFTRDAVVDLLYRLADDALIMGHRDSEWTGLAPILEEDIAFSSMAQDEMGHANAYYEMLHAMREPEPDANVFGRDARHWRNADLACLPNDDDWAFALMRKFLYDMADIVRLTALSASSLIPLAQLTTKLRTEKKYHQMHDRAWILRLGNATTDSKQRMQRAFDRAYPYALGLFEPTGSDEILAQADICPKEGQLQREWASAIAPVLAQAGINIDENAKPIYGGRLGKHHKAMAPLLEGLQKVYKLDPAAKW